MELRHIRYFLALAEELNFSRAAEKLHIAQPPLSRQIQELEQEIGAKLFYRTKRHVELTSAGKVFLQKAYRILDQVEQASISARLSSTGIEGEFRIGFNGTVHDLIPTLQEYRRAFPQVGIILHQMNSREQIEALNEKRIDIGVITIPVSNNKIEMIPLQPIPHKLAMPEVHPLASKRAIHIKDLADETFIITPKTAGTVFYDMFMSAFQHVNFIPKITVQANDLQTVFILVAGGMGITLTPSPTQPINGIIIRDVEDVDLSIQPTIVWRKDNHSEILQKFLKFFTQLQDELQ